MIRRPLVLLTLILLASGGCEHRREPLRVHGDGGPAVVVVEAPPLETKPTQPLADEREPDDDLAHAQPLESGKGISGTISAPRLVGKKTVRDLDFYSFIAAGPPEVDGGTAFSEGRFELSGLPGIDLALEVLDGDGHRIVLANDGGAGQGEIIPNLALSAGHTYYVVVRALSGAAGPAPYSLTVVVAPAPPGDEREPNDRPEEASVLPSVQDASGFFGRRRDQDWLRVPLAGGVAGSTLRLQLSPVDGVQAGITVRAGDTVLAQARGSRSGDLRLRNVGVPAGATEVLIDVQALSGSNPNVRWMLRMGLDPPFTDGSAEREPNDTVASANPLPLGGAVSGFLWPGDVDLYRVTGVPAGESVAATLDGVPGVNLRLERVDASGKVLARADAHGAGQGETLPAGAAGEVLLRVSARGSSSAFDTPYHLAVVGAPAAADLGAK